MSDDTCGSVNRTSDPWLHLRIVAIFVILVTSLAGSLAPIIARRWWKVPTPAFDFVKYFGSGVIIATAFIHLLSPAFDELGSDCLSHVWSTYPFAAAFAMMSMFAIFFVELFAFRFGSQIILRSGLAYDIHAGPTSHTHNEAGNKMMQRNSLSGQPKDMDVEAGITEPEIQITEPTRPKSEHSHHHSHHSHSHSSKEGDDEEEMDPAQVVAQLLGVAILEFGVILHSVIIGLTLAVDDAFRPLFIVLIFHQMFEGLGLGSRLASLSLPHKFTSIPYIGATLYSCMTPLGIAIGLGVRQTYNPDSTTASLVSGTLDALSAGVLLYTGLVELLAHEFLFNPKMQNASMGKLVWAGSCIMLGAGIMALLGRWA